MLNKDDEVRQDTELKIRGDQLLLSASIQEIGGSKYMLIPVKAQEHLKLEETNTSNLKVLIENGPHGPYISAWNSKQKSENERKQQGEEK